MAKEKEDGYLHGPDGRAKYEVDVDRMIDEGLAGGTVHPTYNRVQIEEARELPKEGDPFPDARETRNGNEED